MFFRKGGLRNFAKFTEKHMCYSLFFNKVAGLRPATLLKKRLWHRPKACNFNKKETLAQVFSCEFWEISQNTFFTEHLWTTASEKECAVNTNNSYTKKTHSKEQLLSFHFMTWSNHFRKRRNFGHLFDFIFKCNVVIIHREDMLEERVI